MLRLCVRNNVTILRPLLQTKFCKDITVNLNPCVYLPDITRHLFTTKTKKLQEEHNRDIIYYGPLTPQIKAVKVFSLSSSLAGLIAQPIIIREAATIGSTSLLVAMCSVVGFFTFITPLLLHLVTKKYVTVIRYNPETKIYRAVTINFFMAEKELAFTPDDVMVPDIPGMFTTLIAKGKPLFIEARFFNDPMHYAKIMGYDKPMDFKLGTEAETSESNK